MRQGVPAWTRLEQLAARRPGLTAALLVAGAPLAGLYVYLSFADPDPWARVLLRTLPILPLAVWVLWFDAARPFSRSAPARRFGQRVATLLAVMALAVLLLGLGLNWLDDPTRVL